ncbi:Activation associated secreted protein [Trichostrongylus colubriformis]|uniref:Activation associated secreted protein n=1 Tax=Trichostrongylus colubriformis TaxID=6319 RepID=A0AAN8FTW5_TRICO
MMQSTAMICCALLFIGGHTHEIQCTENIPDAIKGPLLQAINEKRGDVLGNVVYESDCNLATEAFTGELGTVTRDGYTAKSTFDTTWPETIKKAVEEMSTSPFATEVGCSTRLDTGEDGAHRVTLDCKYNTAGGKVIR